MSAEISRRSLMKTSALGSLALASSAFTLPFSQMVRAAQAPVEEKAVWSSCTVNCGSRCLLRLHVKDDTVYWVESDTTGDDVYGNHQVRACLRGRSIRRRMNHPDRLKYPMKRVGKRGEGKFERISWDEALDTISDNLRRILKDYGNEAVHVLYGTGVEFGTMMLASLGPVIISAVVALLISNLINHSDALLYSVQLSVTVQARDYALIISTGVLAGLCGPLLLTLMNACHRGFVSLKLAPPWQLALGGLIVGLLSLFTPAVWGNGYSTEQSFLTAPPLLMIIAGIFLCKLCAVLASSGSGAPGGVFTPTLFIGLAIGMLYGRSLGLWLPDGEEITLLLGLTGMATLLAATTHAPIMSTLMICEMTGEYQLLPGLLIACVIASVISRTLHRDSIYRQHTAKHS